MSQLRTQQVMTSQIRSHTKYLVHTDNIILLFYTQNLRET